MDKIGFFFSGLFNWVLMTSLMASILVVLILLVKLILKDNLKVRWQYIIWFVLIVRLMLPMAPESSFSMFNLFSFMNHQDATTNVSGNTAVTNDPTVPALTAAEEPSQATAAVEPEMKSEITASNTDDSKSGSLIYTGLLLVWLFGVMALVLYLIATNQKLARKTAKCSNITTDNVLSVFEQCKKDLRVRRKIPLKTSNTVEGPTLYGFMRPIILLPAKGLENFSCNELRYIFLHELVHFKRKDVFVNWLTTVLLILHWFNPVLWYAYKKMREDQELSCDAAAVSHIHPDEVKEYGYTIIKLFENYMQTSWAPAVANFSADKSQLKRRIKMITFFKKYSYRWSIVGLTVFILLSGCTLTNGIQKSPGSTQTSTTKPEDLIRTPAQIVLTLDDVKNLITSKGLILNPINNDFKLNGVNPAEFAISSSDVKNPNEKEYVAIYIYKDVAAAAKAYEEFEGQDRKAGTIIPTVWTKSNAMVLYWHQDSQKKTVFDGTIGEALTSNGWEIKVNSSAEKDVVAQTDKSNQAKQSAPDKAAPAAPATSSAQEGASQYAAPVSPKAVNLTGTWQFNKFDSDSVGFDGNPFAPAVVATGKTNDHAAYTSPVTLRMYLTNTSANILSITKPAQFELTVYRKTSNNEKQIIWSGLLPPLMGQINGEKGFAFFDYNWDEKDSNGNQVPQGMYWLEIQSPVNVEYSENADGSNTKTETINHPSKAITSFKIE